MTNKILWGVVGVLVALGLILGVASCVSSCKRQTIEQATGKGAEAKGGSKALQAEAQVTGAKVAEADSKVTDAASAVRIAQEGLQKLRKRPPTVQAQPPTPQEGLPGPVLPQGGPVLDPADTRDAVIAQQDVVIRALEAQVKEMEARDLLLKSQVRQLEGALKLETEARIQAELRAKAAEGLAKANLWKGRVQGFLGGLAVGAAGGAIAAH
mgnify:CR=1 FL=1